MPSPMGFVLSDKVVITIHFAKLHTTSAVLARLDSATDAVSAPDVFAMMIEGVVDFSADQLENIAAELTAISQRVFRRRDAPQPNIKQMHKILRRMLSAIGYAGEHLSQIRESLLGLQRIITYTLETCRSWDETEFLARLDTARHDLQSLIEHETHLSRQGAVPARRQSRLHQHRAERHLQGAHHRLGRRYPADADREHVRNELPLHAGARLALRLCLWARPHRAQHDSADAVVQMARLVVRK